MSVEIPTKRVEKLIEEVNKDEALMDMINKLLLLYKSGAFDAAIELLMTIKNISSIITDPMVDNLALIIRDVVPVIDGLLNSPLIKLLGEALNDVDVDKALMKVKDRGASLADVIGLSRDKDVINGLYLFLTIMKSLGKRAKEYSIG